MKRAVKVFAFILAAAFCAGLFSCANSPVPPVVKDTDSAETTGVPGTTAAPDTIGISETAAPETKPAETTAPETSATVTTAYEEAWTVVTPAGCRTAGSEERIVNGAIEQREIPLLGHDIAKDGHCTRCGERFSYGLRYERETFRPDREGQYLFRIYSENEPEYFCVSVGDCTDTELIIPDYIYGLPVRALAESGFDQLDIASVVIPDTVIEIRAYCFDWCEKLETVVFPASSLRRIKQYAFANCSKLTEIELPDSVKSVFSGAFWLAYPERLEKQRRIVLPENLCAIGNNNFLLSGSYSRSNMIRSPFFESGHVPYDPDKEGLLCDVSVHENGGIYIGSKTNPHLLLVAVEEGVRRFTVHLDTKIVGPFSLAYQLTEVTLPEGLQTISDYALAAVSYPDGFETDAEVFQLESIGIPQTVRYVAPYAFFNQKRLTSLTLPSSVEVLGTFFHAGANPEIVYADGFRAEIKNRIFDSQLFSYMPGFDFSEKIPGWQNRDRT